MTIYTSDPGDPFVYERWREGERDFPIWFRWDEVTVLDGGENPDAPYALRGLIARWRKRIRELERTLDERYPVLHASVDLILDGEVYKLTAEALHAERDYTLEAIATELREDIRRTLGVERTRYFSMLGGKYSDLD